MIRIYENNLLWSQRLRLSLEPTSFSVEIWPKAISVEKLSEGTHPIENVRVAIVNLGAKNYDAHLLIPYLKGHNIAVMAHAGHKEGTLLDIGKDSGADIVATNRELTARAATLVKSLLNP